MENINELNEKIYNLEQENCWLKYHKMVDLFIKLRFLERKLNLPLTEVDNEIKELVNKFENDIENKKKLGYNLQQALEVYGYNSVYEMIKPVYNKDKK